jgi:hypothetical protein
MQTRFVPFEEIDKNKWNGTVHYSPHGNIYGYHWYLKSVIKKWDAIIEGDYQSVMPVFRNPLTSFQLQLLPELGPYSVNAVTDKRSEQLYTLWEKYNVEKAYSFNHAYTTQLYKISGQTLQQKQQVYLDLSMSYDKIVDLYHPTATAMLIKSSNEAFEFGGQGKPDHLLEQERLNNEDKSTLYRLYYNAISRGAGWHAMIKNIATEKQSDAFILSNHKDLYISYLGQNNDQVATFKLLDTLIKSNSGKPSKLFLPSVLTENFFRQRYT